MDTQFETEQTQPIPSPQEMLSRLNQVNPKYFDVKAIEDQLKGNKIWIYVLTLPVSAVLLAVFTLLGTFMFNQPIISFLITAALLFWIGKMFDNQQHRYKYAARQEVINRIAEIEQNFGLIPHFKNFLPSKYRHMWQSVRKGNYTYIEQYVQALVLLQHKLEPEKFIRIWHLTYPDIDSENEEQAEYL
ncbi:hypothetical protein [Thiomicrorhabdus arctica]|uniref:hypothetical protein n=1 Tax=Thiomicrorhabdus arctica TaxID=131540 RepID=UPI0003767B4C|nr:hypothetical protein [Thiomicrorhabdus arctica]